MTHGIYSVVPRAIMVITTELRRLIPEDQEKKGTGTLSRGQKQEIEIVEGSRFPSSVILIIRVWINSEI